MGVKVLAKYIFDNKELMFKRRVDFNGLTIVADGPNLMYGLIKSAKYLEFGGDYSHHYNHLKKFFKQIGRLGIKLFIVMDGGNN